MLLIRTQYSNKIVGPHTDTTALNYESLLKLLTQDRFRSSKAIRAIRPRSILSFLVTPDISAAQGRSSSVEWAQGDTDR